MELIKYFFCIIFLCFLVSETQALENFEARYQIKVRGLSVGTMTQKILFSSGRYEVEAVGEPGALAKIVGYDQITENATGRIEHQLLQPERFDRRMKNQPAETVRIRYFSEQRMIKSYENEENQTLYYEAHQQPLDSSALVVQSMLDVEQKRKVDSVWLINRNKIREYAISHREQQTMTDEKGRQVSVHVFEQINKNRKNVIYIAEHPIRLLRFIQMKDGKNQFELTLMDYKALQ